jgi:ABC-type multidrug transport system fused ATPase/permease subunit
VLRLLITLTYQYGLQRFLETRKQALTFKLFQNYLSYNYQEFAQKNPAAINKLIFIDTTALALVISSGQILFSETFTVTLIYISLLVINWKMTLVLSVILFTKVTFLLSIFSKRLGVAGNKMALYSKQISKLFNESFRNFKLVKLFGREPHILDRFTKESGHLIRTNILRNILLETPRLLLETVGFTILIGTVMYVVYSVATPEHIIPILAVYALAFYRFMPSTSRIMNSYNQIVFTKGTIEISENILHRSEILGDQEINFTNLFEIKNLTFAYKDQKNVLTNISMTIKKQERIAFIGESGAGKSTLADIIMGFYLPKQGDIYIDGKKLTLENIRSWRKKIGYIPQQIYLFDGTVADNITMGRKIDEQKIISTLKKANIYNFLSTKNGLNTTVGEGGILLSGGQMQRIAIARALYSDPEILVLDEATSALDNQTENKIMEEIYNFHSDKTLVVVAHRLSTVLRCEKIYKIENQSIKAIERQELITQQIWNHQNDKTNKENIL